MYKKFLLRGRFTSPIFFNELQKLKYAFLTKKQNFDESLILAAAKRCSKGHVQVLLCKPFNRNNTPFPTSFWLTCPYLIKLASSIESNGGVKNLENFISNSGVKRQYFLYNIFHQVLRIKILGENKIFFLRKYKNKIFNDLIRTGIGGIKYNINLNVKCIHLQTASFLALGFHPAKVWLKSQGLCNECKDDYYCILN